MMLMVIKLASRIQIVDVGEQTEATMEKNFAVDNKKYIMEKSIIILECGKVMKILTTRHLAHGLDVVSYREKW